MGDVNRGNRPLSPFMLGQYYRFQLNSVTSILTRITGNGLILGMLLIVWWLLAAATSQAHFRTADAVLTSWFGDLVIFLSLWALWYHTAGRRAPSDLGRGEDAGNRRRRDGSAGPCHRFGRPDRPYLVLWSEEAHMAFLTDRKRAVGWGSAKVRHRAPLGDEEILGRAADPRPALRLHLRPRAGRHAMKRSPPITRVPSRRSSPR